MISVLQITGKHCYQIPAFDSIMVVKNYFMLEYYRAKSSLPLFS